MTRKQGNKRGNRLPTGGQADQKREEDIITSGDIGIMDKAVIGMVNIYLKRLSSIERYIILKNIVTPSTERTEIESGIREHIDGAKLADLIDEAKAYLAESLNANLMANSAPSAYSDSHEEQPEETVETVFGTVIGVDMSNKNCGMINTPECEYAAEPTELADGAELSKLSDGVDTETAEQAAKPAEARVVRVDDIDDDGPKYNPALEMSFNNLINKSWKVLFDLIRNLSGTEYVTHMPYEMAEIIVKHYYKLM